MKTTRLLVYLFAVIGLAINTLSAQDYPKIGVIKLNSGFLNVRSEPSPTAKKLGSLKDGDEVVILGEENDFYQLQYPKQLDAWIASWLLLDNGTKNTDIVSRSDVNVRSGSNMSFPVIATLSKGTEVHVHEVNADKWAKISPPNEAVAWVAKKFVMAGPTVEEQRAKKEMAQRMQSMMDEVENSYKEYMTAGYIGEADFQVLRNKLDAVAQAAPNTNYAFRAISMKSEVTELRRVSQIKDLKIIKEKEYLAKKAELQQELEMREKELEAREQQETKADYDYEGWVDDIGGILFRPATHVLKEGGQKIVYLKSESPDIDLDDYIYKRVGVKGDLGRHWFGKRVLTVKSITVLHEGGDRLFVPE